MRPDHGAIVAYHAGLALMKDADEPNLEFVLAGGKNTAVSGVPAALDLVESGQPIRVDDGRKDNRTKPDRWACSLRATLQAQIARKGTERAVTLGPSTRARPPSR